MREWRALSATRFVSDVHGQSALGTMRSTGGSQGVWLADATARARHASYRGAAAGFGDPGPTFQTVTRRRRAAFALALTAALCGHRPFIMIAPETFNHIENITKRAGHLWRFL
jgi:hypothetical protein